MAGNVVQFPTVAYANADERHLWLSVAAWALGVSVALWFLFDRVYPRIPRRLFARGEGLLLAVALVAGAAALLRERRARRDSRPARVGLAAALLGTAGLGLLVYLAVGLVGIRYVP